MWCILWRILLDEGTSLIVELPRTLGIYAFDEAMHFLLISSVSTVTTAATSWLAFPRQNDIQISWQLIVKRHEM